MMSLEPQRVQGTRLHLLTEELQSPLEPEVAQRQSSLDIMHYIMYVMDP